MKLQKKSLDKHARSEQFGAVKEAFIKTLSEEELEEKGFMLGGYFKNAEKKSVSRLVLSEGIRLDGRKTTDIRPIECEVDYLPSPHGCFFVYKR